MFTLLTLLYGCQETGEVVWQGVLIASYHFSSAQNHSSPVVVLPWEKVWIILGSWRGGQLEQLHRWVKNYSRGKVIMPSPHNISDSDCPYKCRFSCFKNQNWSHMTHIHVNALFGLQLRILKEPLDVQNDRRLKLKTVHVYDTMHCIVWKEVLSTSQTQLKKHPLTVFWAYSDKN